MFRTITDKFPSFLICLEIIFVHFYNHLRHIHIEDRGESCTFPPGEICSTLMRQYHAILSVRPNCPVDSASIYLQYAKHLMGD